MTNTDVNTTARTVTARKPHPCSDRSNDACTRTIEPGQPYARLVAFPDADFYNGTVPWVLRLCEPCQTQHGQPMP